MNKCLAHHFYYRFAHFYSFIFYYSKITKKKILEIKLLPNLFLESHVLLQFGSIQTIFTLLYIYLKKLPIKTTFFFQNGSHAMLQHSTAQHCDVMFRIFW